MQYCSNQYLRSVPQKEGILSLGSYLVFWGIVSILVVLWLMMFTTEVWYFPEW